MYLPDSAQGMKVLRLISPILPSRRLGDNLANGLFKSLDERHQLMAQAMQL